jgi:drug/metabolite transporter (DMT)-like permease
MTWIAFFLIVTSAMLHASWNLLAKKYHMTLPFYAMICSTAMLMWCHVQFWTPVPVWHMPWQFWAGLAGSVISDALIYCGGLVMAYRYMDMSSAYPMMRSLPLLLTVAVTALFGMGKPLNVFGVTGMVMVFFGCMCMPLKKFSDFNWKAYLSKNMFFVIMCACGTTGYTVFDSFCQQVMGKAVETMEISKPILSVSYYSTRGIVLSSTLLTLSLAIPRQRKHFAEIWKECKWAPFAAGVFASLTYVLVLLSMNYVNNVSYVQVFRQLGLLVGLFAGIVILKEKGSLPKYIGVALIISGLIISVIK